MAGNHQRRKPGDAGRDGRRFAGRSRIYESTGGAIAGPGAERDAVRSFLRSRNLPTAARKRPVYSDSTGLPVDADAPELRAPAAPVADVFDRLLKACCRRDAAGRAERLRRLRMKEAWPGLLGPELAGKLEFEKIDGNVLYAFARNSVELFEIRQFKLRALEAKAKRDPVFKGLRQIRLKCR